MNWCLYRLRRQLVNKEVTAIKDVAVLGLVNVPSSKTADAIMEALKIFGTSINADMFLEAEDGWPVNVRRRWKSLKNKLDWNDLMETIAKRGVGGQLGGSRFAGG
jgi:hypothetical protein